MDILQIEKVNEVYIKIRCEPGIAQELSSFFTFDVPGAKFSPAFRNKYWDGKIRLFNVFTGLLYTGLLNYVISFCEERSYEIEYINKKELFSNTKISIEQCLEFIESLNLPFTPRDYQIDAFQKAIENNRGIFLSPTASGKSLIIYLIVQYFSLKTLIIVPTISLVTQMASDFNDYGFDTENEIHKIYSGESKITEKMVTISTWQSLYKLPKEYFNQFDVVIGDEAHTFEAKSLTAILTKLLNCKYRFGFTGTLKGTKTNRLVLEGLFGPVYTVTTTKELIDKNHISNILINALVLSYPENIRKQVKKLDYQGEIDFLVSCKERNKFIENLALSTESNTLLLFQYVKKHGDILYNMLKLNSKKKVYYVHGGVDGEVREEIRKIAEIENNSIILASYGTFSTGVNIKNIHNIIFSSPSKSRVRNLQSIGRGLRKADNKEKMILFDIADDLSIKRNNYTLEHFMERVKIYNEEQFPYKLYNIPLNVLI
jgi:superfamily II DNA or RNA helicase